MILSGLTILAFVIFHLLHFTVRVDAGLAELGKTNPHKMVIEGFSSGLVVLFYAIAMSLLCSHLSHGVASMFQTLGLRSKKSAGLIDLISKGYALVIWAGFLSIPIAIYIFKFGR
jgi:succinate dehydrogenase / fumarate reductase cytochrome b subunit